MSVNHPNSVSLLNPAIMSHWARSSEAAKGVHMPLVEIDLLEGRSAAELDAISDAVHEALVAELDVPRRDRFQIVNERPPGYLRFDPNYLDIDHGELPRASA
jgi:Tautomerase enzyme